MGKRIACLCGVLVFAMFAYAFVITIAKNELHLIDIAVIVAIYVSMSQTDRCANTLLRQTISSDVLLWLLRAVAMLVAVAVIVFIVSLSPSFMKELSKEKNGTVVAGMLFAGMLVGKILDTIIGNKLVLQLAKIK